MAGTIAITDVGSDDSDLTTYTFSARALGTAAADRDILVGVAWREGGANDRSLVEAGCSIGGEAATIKVQEHVGGGGMAIIGARVPTGTTGDVVVEFNAANSRCLIAVARCTGVDISTALDTAVGNRNNNANGTFTADVDTAADGIAMGYCFVVNLAIVPTLTWPGTDGLTAGSLQTGEGGIFFALNGIATTTAQTPRDIDNTAVNNGGTLLFHGFVTASFSPAAAAGNAIGNGLLVGSKLQRIKLAA